MPTKFTQQSAACIQECRTNFQKRTFFQRLGLTHLKIKRYIEGVEHPLWPHYKVLVEQGTVVWGAMAQANAGIFQPGPRDLPGVTIYSPDSYYDEHPEELMAMCRAVALLKGYLPAERQFQAAANRMTDEKDTTPRITLPTAMTQGRTVYIAATIFHRGRLPDGMLQGGFFPLVIAPQQTEVNMLPELTTWPEALHTQYQILSQKIDSLAAKSPVCLLVQKLEKSPYVKPKRTWDMQGKTVLVTPRVKQFLTKLLAGQKVKQNIMVFLQVDEDGEKQPRFVPEMPPGQHEVLESNGMKIIFPKSQREELRGTVVDFSDTLYGHGFILHDAND